MPKTRNEDRDDVLDALADPAIAVLGALINAATDLRKGRRRLGVMQTPLQDGTGRTLWTLELVPPEPKAAADTAAFD